MTKISDPLLRQWTMLRLVPRHPRKIDATALQAKLANAGHAVSLRSVQRDLLKLTGPFPVLQGDNAKPQGWSWSANATQLELPALDPQAALSFKLVERYLTPLLPTTTLAYLQPWFRTAGGVLDAQSGGLAKWPDKIRVIPLGLRMLPPRIDPDIQSAVYQALLEETCIAVRYQPRDTDAARDYLVNPLALVVRDHIVYLVCSKQGSDEIRHLVLHRIRAVEMREESFIRPAEFDLDAHITQGEFGFPVGDGTLTLEAEFTRLAAAGLFECPLAEDQTITTLEGGNVLICATVPDTAELRWWLLGFGDQVAVRAPASLLDEFMDTAAGLGALYPSEQAD